MNTTEFESLYNNLLLGSMRGSKLHLLFFTFLEENKPAEYYADAGIFIETKSLKDAEMQFSNHAIEPVLLLNLYTAYQAGKLKEAVAEAFSDGFDNYDYYKIGYIFSKYLNGENFKYKG